MEQELYNDERMDISLEETDDLYHHGIKGMKWGVRRFQFKDGSLTKRGEKRYNKEVAKLKAKKKKLKNEERVKKKLGKLDKLKTEVDDLEAKKKADKKNDKSEETVEQKRERLLNSTNAKEIYENRNLLTTQEINERINRIDMEARLQGKIPQEKKQTGIDWVNDKMQKTNNTINNATNLYKSVDSAYNTFVNSTAGKIMENSLGIKFPKGEKPKRQFNKEDFNKLWEKRKELKDDEMRDFANALKTEVSAKQNLDKLNGVNNSNNSKGMNEQDIEDIIKRMVKEDSLEQSAMNSSIDSYDTLMHFGIKGMKWGVHRFYNADGSRTAAGKKRENEARRKEADNFELGDISQTGIFKNALSSFKPKLNEHGWYDRLETTISVGDNNNVRVSFPIASNNTVYKDIPERARIADEFVKRFKDDYVREEVTKEYFDRNTPWINEEPDETPITRKDFKKSMRLDDIVVSQDLGVYEAFYYDRELAYGGHVFVVEGDLKTGKVFSTSLEG